jgi:hypothetical protein
MLVGLERVVESAGPNPDVHGIPGFIPVHRQSVNQLHPTRVFAHYACAPSEHPTEIKAHDLESRSSTFCGSVVQ